MEEVIVDKRIEKSTKYKVLVNYLKMLVEESTVYVEKEKIKLILKALEEVEE